MDEQMTNNAVQARDLPRVCPRHETAMTSFDSEIQGGRTLLAQTRYQCGCTVTYLTALEIKPPPVEDSPDA